MKPSTRMWISSIYIFAIIVMPHAVLCQDQHSGAGQTNLTADQLAKVGGEERKFSNSPSDQEILYSRFFPEPLVPVGGNSNQEQNRALATALLEYSRAEYPDQLDPILAFMREHPKSPWDTALLLNIGIIYRKTGHLSEALSSWQSAWAESEGLKDRTGKALADAALGRLALFYAYLGRTEELNGLLNSVHGRSVTGAATENVADASAGLMMMKNRPQDSFRCGPLALYQIASAQQNVPATLVIEKEPSTARGTSLVQLWELSKKSGLNYQMAYRSSGSTILIPAVVNWKVGHYAAILNKVGSLYRVEDPTFREDIWIRSSTLDEEASGYFLVPPGKLPPGWRSVKGDEGAKIWGRGNTGNNHAPGPGPCDPKALPEPPKCNGGGSGSCGITTYNVDAMPNSLEFHDQLLSYNPPLGVPVSFEIFYMHRTDQQPSTFNYSNLGPKWTSNWISYIVDNTNSRGGTADQYLPGGGLESYEPIPGSLVSFQPGLMTQARLTRKLQSAGQSAGFVRQLPDGSTQVFDQSLGNQYFMTAVRDPQGNGVKISYDSFMRIQALTDAIGQVTKLVYGLPSDPLKITEVVDPFGRKAILNYTSDGHLISATDRIGITSSYTWSENDFISQLTTPYGTTTFATGDGNIFGGFDRFLTITDSLGLTTRVEFAQNPLGDENDPLVPQGIRVAGGLQGLNWRNTFVWNPQQLALATKPDGSFDYSKARVMHFVHESCAAGCLAAAPILESVKEPLENRVWYNYCCSGSPIYAGSSNKPSAIGRVLDDGSTQLRTFQYNSSGHVTQSVDPVGRTFSYTYGPDDIDHISSSAVVPLITPGGIVLEKMPVFQAFYNTQHEPLTTTDSAGETTTMTYNSVGQRLSVTNALGETTKYSYDLQGFLSSVQGPLSGAAVSFTYDTYNRVHTTTNELGYTKTFSYDLADRLTAVAFPDGTTETFTYQLLDLASVSDRMKHTTVYQHDSDRRLISVADPLGRDIQFKYCPCGAISAIIDAAGNTTSFTLDLESRVVTKHYADGSQMSVSYEASISRPHSAFDFHGGNGYVYNLDNTLSAVVPLSQGTEPVTWVSFIYDPVFRRVVSMTDQSGLPLSHYPPGTSGHPITTTYSYNATASTPTPGGGRLATEKNAYGGVISYQYDALGRRVATIVNGVESRRFFDSLGRVTVTSNPLGKFGYFYLGASQRVSKRISILGSSGPTENVSYYAGVGDNLPQQISWSSGAGALLSSFTYLYDADDQVIRLDFTGAGVNFAGGSHDGPSYHVQYDADHELLDVGPLRGQPPGDINYAYTYSSTGNLLSARRGNDTTTFTYNNLNQLTTAGTSYDYEGNISELAGRIYEYGSASVPVSLTAMDFPLLNITGSTGDYVNFGYDGLGRRSRIVSNSSAKWYLWCGFYLCEEHDLLLATAAMPAGPVTKRYFDEGVEINGVPYYYTFDALGSINQLVDSTGAVRAQYQYGPYGNRIQTAGDLSSDLGYTGLFQHQPSGLVLAMFREYAPSIGRWLTRDPLGEFANFRKSRRSPAVGFNQYSNAQNNPLNRIDPSGLQNVGPKPPSAPGGSSNTGSPSTLISTDPQCAACALQLAIAAGSQDQNAFGQAVTSGAFCPGCIKQVLPSQSPFEWEWGVPPDPGSPDAGPPSPAPTSPAPPDPASPYGPPYQPDPAPPSPDSCDEWGGPPCVVPICPEPGL